eukprot:tig00000396_g24900.t1
MQSCLSCPAGTVARDFGSAQCAICPAGHVPRDDRIDCVATSDPIDLALRTSAELEDAGASSAQVSSGRRWLLGLGLGPSRKTRRLLASDANAGPMESQELVFGQNNVTVAQSTVLTEEETLDRVNRLFLNILMGVGGLAAIIGLCMFVYIRLIPAATPEARARRFRLIQRLHIFYDGARFLRVLYASDPPLVWLTGCADIQPEEPDSNQPNADASNAAPDTKGAGAAAEGKEGPADPPRTVPGAFFSIVGIAGVAVAVLFVVVQFGLANFTIVQSLNPGTSPSASDIRGVFVVAAAFRGYGGDCGENDARYNSSGFGGQQVLRVNRTSSRICTVTWSCADCRITADDGAFVRLYLVSRLAMAVSVSYAMKIPEYITVKGIVSPSLDDAVFRGSRPLVIPVDLTPMHFTSEQDGTARYFAAVSSSDTESGQRTARDFALCPPARSISACPDELVSFGVNFKVSQVYLLVYLLVERKVRATVLSTIADIVSLASAAFGAGGQALAAFFLVRGLLQASARRDDP